MPGATDFYHPNTYACNHVELIRGGSAYFQLLQQLIDSAQRSIHFQTYIFDDDETGVEVGAALMNAAQRGVKVQLMADAYASKDLSAAFIERMKRKGVAFKQFEPLLKSHKFYFGRRLHHKVFVVDGDKSLVGGINISNRYNDMPGQPAWLDWALYSEGEVCRELERVCEEVWSGKIFSRKQKNKNKSITQQESNELLVRVCRNDWVNRKNQVSRTYLQMFQHAKQHITLVSSYFLPGRVFRKNMERAAKRGVQIKVITAGNSDVAVSKNAERFLYRWLLKRGIRIFEYQPTVLHGKLSVCDDELVTVGSYNINNISAYASIELNLDVMSRPFAQFTKQTLQSIMEDDCLEITYETYQTKYTMLQRILQWFCYLLFKFIFFLFTFYFRQKE
ncbi:MAG: phospholipase [Chitinophagaceae bacterium]|nr:phospholipase [Chitinophagaceae bacterium]